MIRAAPSSKVTEFDELLGACREDELVVPYHHKRKPAVEANFKLHPSDELTTEWFQPRPGHRQWIGNPKLVPEALDDRAHMDHRHSS